MPKCICVLDPRDNSNASTPGRLAPVIVVVIYLVVFYSLLCAALAASARYDGRPADVAVVSGLTTAAIEMARRIAVYARHCSAVLV
jgi:hypothetical protein